MVSKDTLAATARLRYMLAFLLTLTSIFILSAMASKGGWVMGEISTKWSSPTVTTTKCPDRVPAGSTCKVDSTVTDVISAAIDYGLFGKVKYSTNLNTITSSMLSINGAAPVMQPPVVSSGLKVVNEQDDYEYWAKGNPPYINNVRGTQCFGLWSFLSTVVAGCCLYAALHYSPDTAVTLSRAKIGFFWLLLSFASLFLTFIIWVGTPTSAFTNVCQPCDTPGLCPKDYSCMQLDGGLCPQVTASQGACKVSGEVTKAGGMWGLIFFSFLLQGFALAVWRKLYADLGRSSYYQRNSTSGSLPPPVNLADDGLDPKATAFNCI